MTFFKRTPLIPVLLAVVVVIFCSTVNAQSRSDVQILSEAALTKVVPTSFYFAGQSAETQMRNAAAAQFGKDHYVIAALVDTSGYSTEISGKYEGFLITDTPIMVGNKSLGTGAYGFGFSKSGTLNIFDISSKLIMSTASKNDDEIKRPLQLTAAGKSVRLYKGKSFVVIKSR
jgi:hypothetical protein